MDANQLNENQRKQLAKVQRDELRTEMSRLAASDEAAENQPENNSKRSWTNEGLKSTWEDHSGNKFECLHGPERTVYRRNGEIHRANGPAIEWKNGTLEWWQRGNPVAQASADGNFNSAIDRDMLRGPLGSFELTKIIRAQGMAAEKFELAGRDPSSACLRWMK